MTRTRSSGQHSAPETESQDDPDWSPQIPSIWDEAEDDDALDDGPYDTTFEREDSAFADENLFAPQVQGSERALDWHQPDAWRAAERALGREMLDAAVAVARLDERLLRMSPARRAGLRERLALGQASDLLWAEGARVRPEHLALADRDRVGRTLDEDQVIARARWAVRRMTLETALPATPASVRAFLGLHGGAFQGADDFGTFEEMLWMGLDSAALDEWCAAQTDLGDVHALTRAAAGLNLWRGFGLSAPERLCEPLVLAARVGGAAALGGLLTVPLDSSGAVTRGGGDAVQRLSRWLEAVQNAALKAQRSLGDLDAWAARARRITTDLNGRSPQALIALFEARPVASAKDCAATLSRTPTQTRQLLKVFEDRGLITEITGQQRFRFWKAKL